MRRTALCVCIATTTCLLAAPPKTIRKTVRTEDVIFAKNTVPNMPLIRVGAWPKFVFTKDGKSRVWLPYRNPELRSLEKAKSPNKINPRKTEQAKVLSAPEAFEPLYTGPWVDQVVAHAVTPLWDHAGYLAIDKGKLLAMTDKKKFPLKEEWTERSARTLTLRRDFLQVSGNGEHIAFFYGTANEKGYWILDGKRVDETTFHDTSYFSPDGKRWAYTRRDADNIELVVDGKVIAKEPLTEQTQRNAPFSHVAFSPKGKPLCYVVSTKKPQAFVDGISMPLDQLYPLGGWIHRSPLEVFFFSPNGKQVAFRLGDGRKVEKLVVFQQNPKGTLKGDTARWDKQVIDTGWVADVYFSSEGQWMAWAGKKNKEFNIHYAGRVRQLPAGSPIWMKGMREFSPDGKHLADIVHDRKQGTSSVAVDGIPGKGYRDIRSIWLEWKDKNTLHTYVTDGKGKTMRTVETITEHPNTQCTHILRDS